MSLVTFLVAGTSAFIRSSLMDSSHSANHLPISEWAARQLADYDARQPGTIFAQGLELDVALAYALQSAVVELRVRRGERLIGYKVGCTSPKIRAQLGITHCVTGRLFDTERHADGVVLSRARFAGLAVEGELAVELAREPTEADWAGDGIPACVGRVFPVIELHQRVMRGLRPTAGELIANNAIHAGFVAGSGVLPNETQGEPGLSILADGRELDACRGLVLVRTIRTSLQWLLETVRERGERLAAGDTILTGSIPGLLPVRENGVIRVDAPPFGSVHATFVD